MEIEKQVADARQRLREAARAMDDGQVVDLLAPQVQADMVLLGWSADRFEAEALLARREREGAQQHAAAETFDADIRALTKKHLRAVEEYRAAVDAAKKRYEAAVTPAATAVDRAHDELLQAQQERSAAIEGFRFLDRQAAEMRDALAAGDLEAFDRASRKRPVSAGGSPLPTSREIAAVLS